MSSQRSVLAPLAVVLGLSLLLGCGGGKRPPAVSTAPPPPETDSSRYEPPPAEPIDMGPDIQPMDSSGLGQDYLSMGPDGEGGPLADVYFGYDQFSLSSEAQGTLERHALWLQTHRDLRVTVEGHCDERGTVEYNLALGDQRAQVAREYLIGLGVSPDRLTAVSFGKERPLDPGHDEAAWARNRRAHFVVSR